MLSDLIAKMLQLEKSLFDGGASPYDIAMVVSMAAKGGSIAPITPGRAGHIRPTKHLNVAHEHFLGSLRVFFFRKLTADV